MPPRPTDDDPLEFDLETATAAAPPRGSTQVAEFEGTQQARVGPATQVADLAGESAAAELDDAELLRSLQQSTQVAPKPTAPLKIDFTEVLGTSRDVAGARRIGAQALQMDDFQSKHEKQALERAQAVPKYDLPTSLDHEERGKAVRVVEHKGRFWLWALLAVLVPALVVTGGVFVAYKLRYSGADKDVEALKKADEIHRKAAAEHEKQMAR